MADPLDSGAQTAPESGGFFWVIGKKYHFLEKQDKTGYIKANAKTENKRAG